MQELIADLTRRLAHLESRNRALESRNRALDARLRELEDATATPPASPLAQPPTEGDREPGDVVSRRGLLRQLGTAAAVAGGAVTGMSVVGARPAAAAQGAFQYGTANNAGTDWTILTSSCAAGTFLLSNTAADSMGSLVSGVENTLNGGPGVLGYTEGPGQGVWGRVTDANSTGTGVRAQTDGKGRALEASSTLGSNTQAAVAVTHAGLGRGINVSLSRAGNTTPGVMVTTQGTGAGVDATSVRGVGGRFAGKTAQVRLAASSASSHPAGGVKGDLFVDKSGRLWFCKGGSSWKQLA